ncbi:MAG: isoleucine--tRNA ligase [Bdellovibrionales bacterium]|nr:isoleucine--tRNA ligase [Bdellovibrionales bacterium]
MSSSKASFSQFPEYGSDYSFAAFETQVLDYWKRGRIFDRVLDQGKSDPTYFFYDGPPFATGLPHYGHILAGTIKDIVPRYWTMRGYRVPRRFGWDCHGLPVEFEMEKTLNLSGSLAIMDYGVGKFNEACRSIVLRYTSDWRKSVERMGRWIDMDNDYKTMDPSFMESVWWVFKELWNKGLVYEGKKVVPYSWRLTAPLSNFEASLNYKDVQDPAITVLFPIVSKLDAWVGHTAFAVWTTTPWTLPANLAVAINTQASQVTYGRYKLPQAVGEITHVIVADSRAEAYALTEKTDDVSAAMLIGAHYQPLFSCYDDADRKADRAFRVVAGDNFVSSTDGTGIVHMAPAFGEDDFYTCQREKIRLVDPTDMQASFTPEAARDPRLAGVVGQFVKDGDKTIIKLLKEAGRLLKQETLQHAYPFCERSDTPLIYKAISSWFVNVEAIKERMLKNNAQIHWVPEHIKDGRFGKWLENARDWCISRNRFWGTPIPVWRCSACHHFHVVGSRAELDALAGRHVDDLHKHFVDEIHGDCPKCRAKNSLTRTSEVLDCWFESGSMPYAQEHYPFENKEKLEKGFPADFIGEGLDQTRGWFYTLTVLSTALFDKPAFKNCIVNGMVLAEDGKKMSKRLKNYPDPNDIFNKYGADALRLYLMQSPAMHGEELRFSEKGLLELMRAVMLPLWNAYGFFSSYANIDGWHASELNQAPAESQRPLLDRWILARGREVTAQVHAKMEDYRLADVAPLLIDFIDDLTNWYIRLSRERFWSADNAAAKADKHAAYATLWTALDTLAGLMAPSLPYMAETLHQALRGRSLDQLQGNLQLDSVHQRRFDNAKSSYVMSTEESTVLSGFRVAKNIILLGRSLRGEAKIGLRQPLPTVTVAGLSAQDIARLEAVKGFVLKELNVKQLAFAAQASDLAEESAKPNFKTLGKKVGGAMKDVQAALAKWSSADIQNFEKSQRAVVHGFELGSDDIAIQRKAKPGRFAMAGQGLVVELDTTLTPELEREGLQREIINRIQQRRKDTKLHLADRIQVRWWATSGSKLHEVLQSESKQLGLIAGETLSVAFRAGDQSAIAAAAEDFGPSGSFAFEIEKA